MHMCVFWLQMLTQSNHNFCGSWAKTSLTPTLAVHDQIPAGLHESHNRYA